MAKALTEAEWLTCENPAAMVDFVRRRKESDRKLRLFGCACCRRLWKQLPSDASRRAVEVAEQFAEGNVKRKELNAAHIASVEGGDGTTHDPAEKVTQVSLKMAAFWASYDARIRAAGTGPLDFTNIAAHTAAQRREGLSQSKLLHDLFGNPFRPVAIEGAWRTQAVVTLAQSAYDERRLPSGELEVARLAVLSDALEEAGCADDTLLSHLRSLGPHVRGCWVVDLILGKK